MALHTYEHFFGFVHQYLVEGYDPIIYEELQFFR